jgi:hypothetical protein
VRGDRVQAEATLDAAPAVRVFLAVTGPGETKPGKQKVETKR